MAESRGIVADGNRVLVKMRPSNALRAAESRVNLRPLYESTPATETFGLDATPQWFVADLPEPARSPWDLAHAQVAAQLGVAESDVLFAEPDIIHDIYQDPNSAAPGKNFGAALSCQEDEQDAGHRKATGQGLAWHLDDAHSQLGSARAAVHFTDPRTRIAHVDTGYHRAHATKPAHIMTALERNFVERDGMPGSAQDPDNRVFLLDNSGHGTGTISILAGGTIPSKNVVMGGAPDAEVLPLRVADSVVLLRTSALARALEYAVQQRCDVITMSMGGLPSRAWAEAVDKLYEAGVVFCAAAGNHTGKLPPKVLVYPARYERVIAVCGVMANGTPYAGLDGALEGSFGPDAVMGKALAAYTPNIPWARFGCNDAVRFNGEGTSSATPQVAAAAALWIEKYKNLLPRNFQRVEAVRHALFSTAKGKNDRSHFGNGVVQALAALAVTPKLDLPMSAKSKNSFAFLRLVTGLGITQVPPREEMFNLELVQRWLLSEELQEMVPDPEAFSTLDEKTQRRFMDAIIADPQTSLALRRQVAGRYPVVTGQSAPSTPATRDVVAPVLRACDAQPELRNPPYRRVRVYASDPSLSARFETAGTNEVTLNVRWEDLEPGPSGEYLSVEDEDPTPYQYEPVDLNEPRLLAQDGWAPSEGNPQFHQQMVYAVAMKTIEHFERALGRPVLWRHRANPENEFDDSQFVRQLSVRPHALRQANAFYSPTEIALLFGYFEAPSDQPGEMMPGSRVYSCLSHDIVAHETTHAILDGMHRRFNEPTNLDVLAFHEAFADIVALLQHFTIPEVLEAEIARSRGNIESAETMLGSLAVQFGQATGGRGALRNAIGRKVDGKWVRFEPDPADLKKRVTPHTRGAILVGAVFDAFLTIYNARVADLLRIYTGGTGVLPNGSIHPDLVRRLADEATKAAGHVLTMCIRALDYLPPVDVTFFEYLRALITADADVVGDDRYNYRVAFVEAFRRRGIYPISVSEGDVPRTFSVDTLRWQGIDLPKLAKPLAKQYDAIVGILKRYANAALYIDNRKALFRTARNYRVLLHGELEKVFAAAPEFAAHLGLDLKRSDKFEVHELRRAMRISPDGRYIPQVVVALTQSVDGFRGGSTLIVDLSVAQLKYVVIKNIGSENRQKRTAEFIREAAADPLRALFFAPDRREPFAALHSLAEDGF